MSKVDANRAMREAKYARGGKVPDPPGTPAARASAPVVRKAAVVSDPEITDVSGTGDTGADSELAALCGHRNMGGKSCSRPAGHSEKNHRYASA